jgi:hypothetical protein
MRKAKHTANELRAEYKLSDFKTKGVRGKHVKRYRAGTNLVLLAPDVARAFPTDKAVNDALSRLIRAGKRTTSTVSRSTSNGRKR